METDIVVDNAQKKPKAEESCTNIVVSAVTTSSRQKRLRTRKICIEESEINDVPKKTNAEINVIPSLTAVPETIAVPKSDSEGIFWFEEPKIIIENARRTLKGLSSRERQQLIEINKTNFYTKDENIRKVVQLNDENSDAPRLRAYDWAVTNYAKGHPKSMLLQKKGQRATIVDPNLSYEGELRRHHRLLFDPFRRGTHIFFEIDGLIHRTTVGQLTFIKWCMENEVDQYVENNLVDIRQHMSSASRKKSLAALASKKEEEDAKYLNNEEIIGCKNNAPYKKRRRTELTRAPTKLVRGLLLTSFDIMTDTISELKTNKKT
jgi:uncharacterized protein (UPF0216 family)